MPAPIRLAIRTWTAAIMACLAAGGAAEEPPTVDSLFPPGGQRGKTVAVTADGKFPTWPPSTQVDSGEVKITPLKETGQFEFAVSADARPGRHWVRCYTDAGASRVRPFVVGTVSELVENGAPDQSVIDLAHPLTVNGRLSANNEVDTYPITVQTGEAFVASLDAYRGVGSPMDAVMQLYDVDNAIVLSQVDDAPGKDPRIVWPTKTSPRCSTNLAIRLFAFPETPNQRIGFAGAKNFIYRLTISAHGFVDFATPLSVNESRISDAKLTGWRLSDDLPLLSSVLFTNNAKTATIFHANVPGLANVSIRSIASVVEKTDSSLEKPLPVSIPSCVTGWIETAGDGDTFAFTAEKDQALTLRVDARSLNFPTDPVLEIFDEKNKRLEKSDDKNGRDCVLRFKPHETATYTATIRDLYGHSSSRHRYLFTIQEPVPNFRLSVANELNVSSVGDDYTIDVIVKRENGFEEEIYIAALGLPNRVTTNPATSQPDGDTAEKVSLVLNALNPVSQRFAIVGTTARSERLVRAETPAVVPNTKTTDLWFSATASADKKEDKKEDNAK